jgi:hypothetical protein
MVMPAIDILKLVVVVYAIGAIGYVRSSYTYISLWDEKTQGPLPKNFFVYAMKKALIWPILLFNGK